MKHFILCLLVSATAYSATDLIQTKSISCTKLTQDQLSISLESAYEFCKIDDLAKRACVQDKVEQGIDINTALKDC